MGAAGQVAISTDGTNFVAATGLPTSFFDPGSGRVIKVDAEWQMYSYGKLFVSTDGIAFTERVIAAGFVNDAVAIGDTVLTRHSGNTFNVSINKGVDFVQHVGPAATTSIEALLAIPGVGFLSIGRNGSGNMIIGTSATGLSNSWTTVAGPTNFAYHGITRNPDTGRIYLVVRNNSSFSGDSYYSDDNGVTWTQGASYSYGAANTTAQSLNPVCYYNGYVYATANQGGGNNGVFRSLPNLASWTSVLALSGGNAIESVTGFTPA